MSSPHGNYSAQTITVKLIRNLSAASPPAQPREIRDKQAGLILRHQPSGYLGLYVNLGRAKRERLCDARCIVDSQSAWTLGKARIDARRLRVQHTDGRDFASERQTERAVPTLKAFIENTYGPWVERNRRSGTATLARLGSLFVADFGTSKISELSPAKLEPWRARRQRDGVTAETINRDIVALRGALSRAVKLDILSENPLRGIEKEEVDRHRRVIRALTGPEKSRLLEALVDRDNRKRSERANSNMWREERNYELRPPISRFADVLTPAVITSLETGLRRGELFALEWPLVDLELKTLQVRGSTAKSFETREIPLNEFAYSSLREWWLQCGQPKHGLVFASNGSRLTSLKTSFYAALKNAGISRVNRRGDRITWHSLRHTFGSLLGAAGVDSATLMKLMGHANLATTQRYLHTDSERKRSAVELLAREHSR